jgi:GNAT superfamily N-acetyltransferase
MTPLDLLRLSDENLRLHCLALCRSPRGSSEVAPDLTWTASGYPFYNRVLNAHLEGDPAPRIEAIKGIYAALNMPHTWLISPLTRPADLGGQLEAHGYKLIATWSAMTLDLRSWRGPQLQSDFSVKRVETADELDTWIQVVEESYNLPRGLRRAFYHATQPSAHRYYGLVDGEAITSVEMFFASPSAGLYMVGTLPEWRGRGYASVLLANLLGEIDVEQYPVATLQATTAGRSVYTRLGFRDIAPVQIYHCVCRKASSSADQQAITSATGRRASRCSRNALPPESRSIGRWLPGDQGSHQLN